MSLKSIAIDTQLNWLASSELRNDNSAARFLPHGFGAYLVILLPLGIDRGVPIEQYSFSTRTIQDLNARVYFWNQYGIVNGNPPPENLEHITYREIAQQLGLPYDATFNSEAIFKAYGNHWPPHLGGSEAFDKAFIQSLVALLGADTATYFYGDAEDGKYHFTDDGLESWFESGIATDLDDILQQENDFPTYTFATDHSWCLYHQEDASWLVLGCSRSLAETIAASVALESFTIS
ncbi:hypothetical protein SAMN00120144_3521 [Hymenobacter roseosalivarius DSM 11622]|uniref:Uncharacterized protein n=2 Tax=Hymenobacter roseosalivarius TaxID=89967 RepID=A0A1W1VY57_9BACT|nr:hypothetical protein SAMN00120144_3521 [Hymenobacter roseosalivarius DSM 11622]